MANEKRLIDANRAELYDAIGRNAFRDRQDIIDLINNQPTVDAVEVVRCKDCIAHNLCKFEQSQGLDGFCSYGERKCNGKWKAAN